MDIAPLPAEPEERARRCAHVAVCPHKGGDAIHHACADGAPPNQHQGCDVFVNGYHFDAIDPTGRVLWEVKTDNWSSYTEWLQEHTLEEHVKAAKLEYRIAEACNFGFVFAVSDKGLYNKLRRQLSGIQVRHVPECGVTRKP